MPRTVLSMGDQAKDREIDALWAALDALKKGAGSSALAPVESLHHGDSRNTITVQTDVGEPITVTGLEFVAGDGFTVNDDNGLGKIDLTAGAGALSLTATAPIVATPSPITGTGVLSHGNSAVTPGSYTNANVTVDAKGHVTAASNGSGGSGIAVEVNDGAETAVEGVINFIPGTFMDSISANVTGSDINVTINAADQSATGGTLAIGDYNAVDVASSGILYTIFDSPTGIGFIYNLPALQLGLGAAAKVYTFFLVNRNSVNMVVRGANPGGGYTQDTIGGSTSITLAPGAKALLSGIATPNSPVPGDWTRFV